ncbi:hypothetical protein TWF694_000483 [Orbilia ellipsospora]|uniref:Uncharacterized protein n=1 Tax=Orbilia ellipsospora TaxID=2528407 RepID=A0AAV9XPL3_9PEZI
MVERNPNLHIAPLWFSRSFALGRVLVARRCLLMRGIMRYLFAIPLTERIPQPMGFDHGDLHSSIAKKLGVQCLPQQDKSISRGEKVALCLAFFPVRIHAGNESSFGRKNFRL